LKIYVIILGGNYKMGSWIIRWNFNRQSYKPGQPALISFWLENTSDTYLHLSDLELEFDFGTYNLETISGMISPRANKFLGSVSLQLPKNIVGRKIFKLKYRMYEYIDGSWVDLGSYPSDKQYFISVYPRPFYRVFLSRGLRMEDRAIGDSIAEMVREWGFETVTVGIEVKVPEEQVAETVRREMKRADAVIALATPRFMDALTGLWKTLEWAHDEVGIAFGIDKPLLILKDETVTLGGLPSYLAISREAPIIEFNPYNMEELRLGLSTIMPGFREWIETKRKQEFSQSLGKILVGGLAVIGSIAIIGGSIGALSGASKK
jgi:hypothetical protein